ncbi:MAG: DNA polymerase III subunit gamma/tau [Patescibacteria group bacterium]
MAFYQRYRAKNFNEMVGQQHVVATLLASIKSGRLVHAYLLTGPRGIGKTSTARLLAKAINCKETDKLRKNGKEVSGEPCNVCDACSDINLGRSIDVIEIDAASNTGVDNIRDLIEKARLMPTNSLKKVYIIDEVHMLSKGAFNALLKTLEEPPEHVIFIMATTEVHKIPATILSRAQRYDFKRASKDDLIENLERVSESEKMTIDREVLDLIAAASAGGHRDALSLLEQLNSISGKITLEKAREVLGLAKSEEILKLIGTIFNNQPEEGLKIVQSLYTNGSDLAEFNKAMIETMRRILLLKAAGEVLFEDTEENIKEMRRLSETIALGRLVEIIENFIEANSLLKNVHFPVMPIEIAIIKSIPTPAILPTNEAIKPDPLQAKPPASQAVSRSQSEVSQSSTKILVSRPDSERADKPDSPAMKSTGPEISELSDQSTVPVQVLEMTKDIWKSILDKVKVDNATLFALLKDANPEGMTDDALTLAVKFKFHREKISEGKNMKVLEDAIREIAGRKLSVICKEQGGQNLSRAKIEKIDLEKTVGEVFQVEE